MPCSSSDQILVTFWHSWLMNVVADAVSGWVAAWYDGVVKGVQERCSLDQGSLVFLHRALDGQEHVFMSAGFQRIRFTRVLMEIEEKRWVVLGHAIALTIVAIEVVFKRETPSAFLTVLVLTADALGSEVGLVLADAHGHQGVLAVVEERGMRRCRTFEKNVLDALSVVDTVCGKSGASEVSCSSDDVHGCDELIGDSRADSPRPVHDVRDSMSAFP